MAIVLIAIASISLWLILFFNEPLNTERVRASILKTLILQACLITVSTEALSAIRALNFTNVALFWLLISIVNSYLLYSRYRDRLTFQQFQAEFAHVKLLTPSSQRSIAIIAAIALISLIICLIAPPNNYDSLTYHMTRVMQWIQNRSVEYYPTHNVRQIYMPPGASYIVTHFQILADGDRFATSVQWIAYIGSILGTSLIAKQLFGDRTQWISAVIAATVPMAIMQSTTTQTDLVTSLWLVCFAYFVFRFSDRFRLFWIAASLSLAILTKPTGIIFGSLLFLVFAVLIVREGLKQQSKVSVALLTSFKYCTLVGLGSLLLPMPSWMRNYKAVGNFLGGDYSTKAEVQGLAEFASNLLKNLTLNLPIPGFTQFVVGLHQNLLPVNLNEPRLSFGSPTINFDTVMVSPITLLLPSEDNIANPVHLILGAIALVSLFTVVRQLRPLLLGSVVVGGYLLSCYLLKWQPWGNRLILPLFFLQAPITAYYLTTIKLHPFRFDRIAIALLSVVAIFYALTPMRHPLIALPSEQWSPEYLGAHQSKSILGLERKSIYYSATAKALELVHQNAVDTMVDQFQCQTLGYFGGDNDVEYPIWVLLKEKTGGKARMKHVGVKNESQKLPPEFPDSEVCAILPSRGSPKQVKVQQP